MIHYLLLVNTWEIIIVIAIGWTLLSIVVGLIIGHSVKINEWRTGRTMEEEQKYNDGYNLKYWK